MGQMATDRHEYEYRTRHIIEVWGENACFTRPEFKTERVSYDVITPSAARAIYSAIFWKPAIEWRIKKIEVLNPIKWACIRYNETAKLCVPGNGPIYIEKCRQQRNSLLLENVRYRLHADLTYIPPQLRRNERDLPPRQGECPAKYNEIFIRRAAKGQCIRQPYLGCSEYGCRYKYIPDLTAAVAAAQPIPYTTDLGYMLYDMDYSNLDNITPMFYRARMVNGVIDVPEPDSPEVLK